MINNVNMNILHNIDYKKLLDNIFSKLGNKKQLNSAYCPINFFHLNFYIKIRHVKI